MMSQVWITGPGAIEVRRVPVPSAGPGEVVVRTAYAGICGSDLHTLRRGHPWLPYPIQPGHEASGVVETAGPGVDRFTAGDAVYLRPAIACGDCFYCGRDKPNLCERLIGVGSHRPGAFADRFAVPVAALAPVPTGMSLGAAAMIEPLATAVHAVGMVRGSLDGATVLVLGGGSIGQCMLLAARAFGARAVVVTDPVESKRKLAVSLGAVASLAPDAVDESSGLLGGRPDVVFDCVATSSSVSEAVGLATRGGSVVIVGVGHGPVTVALEVLQDQEVSVAGSAMYTPADFEVAERLDGHRLVTATWPIDDARAAFAAATGGHEVKIHLTGALE